MSTAVRRNASAVVNLGDQPGSAKNATTAIELPNRRTETMLRIYIGVTAMLHLGGAIATLILMLRNTQIVPLVRTYIMWPAEDSAASTFSFGALKATEINMGLLVLAFFLLSFFFQIITIVNIQIPGTRLKLNIWKFYITKLTTQCINPFRWIEYSFSASCLFLLGSLINGVTELHHVMLIFVAMWVVMILGLVQEVVAFYLRRLEATGLLINTLNAQIQAVKESSPRDVDLTSLAVIFLKDRNDNAVPPIKRNILEFVLPHLVGWVLYIFLWAAELDRFKLGMDNAPSNPPTWVIAFYVIEFFLFSSFGFNQFYQMVRLYRLPIGKFDNVDEGIWSIAIHAEWRYVTLSVTAKTLCGYFLLSGMLASSSAAKYA
jgi:hypothetical protein